MSVKRICCTLLLVGACLVASPSAIAELAIARPDSRLTHFTYRGDPLLSFGGMSDFIFYFQGSDYDYRQWVDWQTAHGMNHLRAYPPLSYRTMEVIFDEDQVPADKLVFPYVEVEPGGRLFDLEQFNDAYWQDMREKLAYLHDNGIIVHLIVFNGWNITHAKVKNWNGHFFNPAVNINPATNHLSENEHAFYYSVADGRDDLVALQKAWIRKLVEVTAGFDNVYYDLVHELAKTRDGGWITEQDGWEKVKPWIEEMATTLRDRYRELNGREAVVGLDGGPFNDEQRDWIYSRPYFDILVYGKRHDLRQALQWRSQYRKPYVPQESWDDSGEKWTYRNPAHRTHIRKYVWKMMMVKAQQIDLYVKPPRESYSVADLDPPGVPQRYDPRGWNEFEKDAALIRQFWNTIDDYGSLRFRGKVEDGPGDRRHALSSTNEALIYLYSRSGREDVRFEAQELQLTDLALPDGEFVATLFSPIAGPISTRTIMVRRQSATLPLPAFTDDLAIRIAPAAQE